MFSKSSILVTGGAGFIGGHIVERLVALDVARIRILDNLSTGTIEFIHHLQSRYSNSIIDFIHGDITDLDTVRRAVRGCDKVCHHAAVISVPESVEDPLRYHQINDTGFLNVLLACKEQGIKRIVYASSAAVYGNNCQLPLSETDTPTSHQSPYGLNKFINEQHAELFSHLYEMECIGLRYFNVFGPRQNPNNSYAGVISKFVDLVSNDHSPIIYGNGEQTRDFVFVSNVVDANILALSTLNVKTYGEVFNIGTHHQTSILTLLESIQHILEKQHIQPIHKEVRRGDIEHSCADITKARTLLNYNPTTDLKDGLSTMIDVKCAS